jgi:alpha-D-ribose 1-methylphosphonate 5-triphosphate synthase subunit PhnH
MTQLAAAFDNPVFASQAVFRAVMGAVSRPGVAVQVAPHTDAPAPLCSAAAAIALALLDYETPVWLDAPTAQPGVIDWLKFHTGAPVTQAPELAAFVFITDAANTPDFARFCTGTPDYPDRSTTIVMQVDGFSGGDTLTLSGPGIQRTQSFSATPLPGDFGARLRANRQLFPRGVDLLLACGDAVMALPRSIRIVEGND